MAFDDYESFPPDLSRPPPSMTTILPDLTRPPPTFVPIYSGPYGPRGTSIISTISTLSTSFPVYPPTTIPPSRPSSMMSTSPPLMSLDTTHLPPWSNMPYAPATFSSPSFPSIPATTGPPSAPFTTTTTANPMYIAPDPSLSDFNLGMESSDGNSGFANPGAQDNDDSTPFSEIVVSIAGILLALRELDKVVKEIFNHAVSMSDPRLVQSGLRQEGFSTTAWNAASRGLQQAWIPLWWSGNHLRNQQVAAALREAELSDSLDAIYRVGGPIYVPRDHQGQARNQDSSSSRLA